MTTTVATSAGLTFLIVGMMLGYLISFQRTVPRRVVAAGMGAVVATAIHAVAVSGAGVLVLATAFVG